MTVFRGGTWPGRFVVQRFHGFAFDVGVVDQAVRSISNKDASKIMEGAVVSVSKEMRIFVFPFFCCLESAPFLIALVIEFQKVEKNCFC